MSFNVVGATDWDKPSDGFWGAYAASGATAVVASGSVGTTLAWDAPNSSAATDFFEVDTSGSSDKITVLRSGIVRAAFQLITQDGSAADCYAEVFVKFPPDGTQIDRYTQAILPTTYTSPLLIPVAAGCAIQLEFSNSSAGSKTVTYWEADLRMLLLV